MLDELLTSVALSAWLSVSLQRICMTSMLGEDGVQKTEAGDIAEVFASFLYHCTKVMAARSIATTITTETTELRPKTYGSS